MQVGNGHRERERQCARVTVRDTDFSCQCDQFANLCGFIDNYHFYGTHTANLFVMTESARVGHHNRFWLCGAHLTWHLVNLVPACCFIRWFLFPLHLSSTATPCRPVSDLAVCNGYGYERATFHIVAVKRGTVLHYQTDTCGNCYTCLLDRQYSSGQLLRKLGSRIRWKEEAVQCTYLCSTKLTSKFCCQ